MKLEIIELLREMKKANNLTTTNQGLIETLIYIDEIVYSVHQVEVFVYGVLCIFWFVYIIIDIFTQLRNKRKLVNNLLYVSNSYYVNSLFVLNETIFRNYLFLIFLIFEIIFCSSLNFLGVLDLLDYLPTINISIGYNCTLESDSFIGSSYDYRIGGILRTILYFLCCYSFSMMIWLFGASLLHLSIAARNELKVKRLLKFILFGMIYNFIVVVFEFIPYTSVFGYIARSVMNQLSFFVVLYIAKKEFIPAMNSRIIDAFHLHNTNVYLKQKRLLKLHKTLIFVFLFTFELSILNGLIFYNISMILDFISSEACWFHVTYHFPIFSLSDSTKNILSLICVCSILFCDLINSILFFNFIIVYLNFIYVTLKRSLKRRFEYRMQYRYQIFSAPLLSD